MVRPGEGEKMTYAQERIKAIDFMVAEAVSKRNGNVDAIEEAVIFIEMAAKWDSEHKAGRKETR